MEHMHTSRSWMEEREMQPDTHRPSAGLYADGVVKEHMQIQLGIRAVMEVGHGVHRRTIDTEEYHENPDHDMIRSMMSEFGVIATIMPLQVSSDRSVVALPACKVGEGKTYEMLATHRPKT